MVVIGDLNRQVFLSIPPEGLDLLKALAEGHTVGEAVRRYEQTHGETPDIDDFLDALADEGFVAAPAAEGTPVETGPDLAPAGRKATLRWSSHLEWLSPQTCRRLLSAPVLVLCGLITAGGIGLIIADPGVMPPPTVLVFTENFSLYVWVIVFAMLSGIMVHECAHVVAARAAGIPARIGIGNRLYIVVIETDMSGIWLAPKRARYLAFLAGPLIDCVGGALVVAVLFAMRHGAFQLPPGPTQLVQALLWLYLGRLMWQCFFFLRTDFYYVFASMANCRDLKADTENFLRNLLARTTRIGRRIDQSAIPRREMRAIRGYAGMFLLGNAITIAALIFVTLPILFGYLVESFYLLTGQPTTFSAIDLVTLIVLALMIDVLGIVLWIRALRQGFRQRRARRRTLVEREQERERERESAAAG